jgi:hypothetical protein
MCLQQRQQNQSREVAELTVAAQKDKLAAERELEEIRRKASQATRDAALTIAQVRGLFLPYRG